MCFYLLFAVRSPAFFVRTRFLSITLHDVRKCVSAESMLVFFFSVFCQLIDFVRNHYDILGAYNYILQKRMNLRFVWHVLELFQLLRKPPQFGLGYKLYLCAIYVYSFTTLYVSHFTGQLCKLYEKYYIVLFCVFLFLLVESLLYFVWALLRVIQTNGNRVRQSPSNGY